jgi:hypothetical protein
MAFNQIKKQNYIGEPSRISKDKKNKITWRKKSNPIFSGLRADETAENFTYTKSPS